MTRLLAPAIVIGLVCSCGGSREESVAAKDTPAAPETAADRLRVRLPASALQGAGVAVETVTESAVPETIAAPGHLTANENRTWHVGAIVEGRVMRVEANVGDRVAPGKVLAWLHSHGIHESRADYQKASSERARLLAERDHLQRVRDRAKRLYELKAGSLADWESAEAELKSVGERITQAEAEVERARVHLVEFLGVALEEPSEHKPGEHGREDWIPVRSPASGIVIERLVSAGSVAPAAGPLFTITDPSTVWMLASLAEEHYSKVRPGMVAEVRVQAHPDRVFTGKVIRMGDQLDPDTRTAEVRIELANPGGALKPEMYGEARLRFGGSRKGLFLPGGAVQELRGASVVFVERGPGEFEAVTVDTGTSMRGLVEVMGGLAAGDRVVVRGSFLLKSELLRSSLAEE